MLKIVFMGSPDFAIPSLEAVHHSRHQILAVVTNPDKKRGRGGRKSPTIVKKTAIELGYPVIETDSTGDPSFAESLMWYKPDLFVVVAFRVLPPEILKIPTIGSINVHASLLPEYRGAAPIHHAILDGKRETGCSIFFLEKKVDTGDIILQNRIEIGLDETTGELYDRLKVAGAGLLLEALDKIDHGEAEGIPQDESKASAAPKVFVDDAKIDFSQPADNVHNRIRAMNPFPGAWAKYGGETLKIHRSKIGPEINLAAGELILRDDRLIAGCGSGTVELKELQLPGKKKITGKEFTNGYDLSVRLE